MKYFRDDKNIIHGFELDGSQDYLINKNMVALSVNDVAMLFKNNNVENSVKGDLAAIDLNSIRAIREYIASKADAPQILKDRETLAAQLRAKLK